MSDGPKNPPILDSEIAESGKTAVAGLPFSVVTLRDIFAVSALHGMASNGEYNAADFEALAEASYEVANAMLAQRDREPGKKRGRKR